MIRYQIRNEYGLSDPKLYAPGEKDDPEALLEGVAMAGLVGVLRQLGDLAEFAAEIFHDLHEDVMTTASRGHGLMLRLQQLEAEFPAVEKAIISQTDHSNYPHDDGVEWHANLQLNQNMITQGDMPRFILDSYEECHGPPRLFTLDKFDVAGAGASLKRYSDPSFFKMEHASNMIETDSVIEKKPRKIKKKAMRWRKGETLESLLVANSESHSTTSKDRASRKVPPRTTKLKSRNLQDSDRKTISRICREQLQEVISSQQKILSNYSARHYHAKFRSTDSSETASSFGELDNLSAPAQSSAKLELTKVVPINEYDTVEMASTPINGSVCLEADDGQFLATQHGPVEVEEACKRSVVEQNGVFSTLEKLQDGPDFKGEESNCTLQSAREEKLLLAAVPVNQDVDRRRPDDIGSDQENFVDALNNMESEGEMDHEMKTKRDLSAEMEADKLNCHSKEGENALHVQFSQLGPAIDLSSVFNDSCNGGEPTSVDSFLIHDSSPSAVPATKDPNSDSPSCRQLSDVDWANDEEPFNDVDLMDVSSSSSVLSDDNGNFETNDNLNGCEQNQDGASLSSNDYHAAVAHSSDKQSPQRSSGMDGLAISSNDYTEKAYRSLEHGENFVLDRTTMIFGKPNDVSQDDEEIEVGNVDDLLLQPTVPNQEEMQLFKKQFEEGISLDGSTSLGKLASLPDMGPVMHMNDVKLDNVAVTEEIVANTTPTGLGPDDIHKHLDELDSGVAPIHSSMLNNPLYESHDDEIVEELHSLPDDDLYKHVAEDQEIIALGKGPCSTRFNTHKEDPMQASIVPRDFSNVQEFPGLTESVSPPQDDKEAHVDQTPAPSPCMSNDDTKPLLIGGPLASSTASLLDTGSSCVEHCESTEIVKTVECGEVLVDAEVAEESTTSTFEDNLIPSEEVCTDGAKCTENAEILATNSREEISRHDVQLQSSSPCREDLEIIEATCENLGSLDESREHVFKESLLQTDNLPQLFELETTCETFIGGDDIQYLSPLHFPEESVCLEELPEETNLSAEVLCQCDLDKDGAVVSLQHNMVGEQPSDDQDLVREPSAQDSFGTNPFMDPGYIVSHTQTDPSPSMSYQPCFSEEEQDFLSELLMQHGNTGAKENLYPLPDSLWEPATPPDEAPLPSEVMTEEDFRSFCHEYHEMDFTVVTEGFDNKPSSDSNDNSNGYMVSELEFPCSVSALPAGLDQEACVCSKTDPQLAECSSATHIPGEMPFSAKKDPDDETPGVDSDLKSHESFSDEKIPELDVPSVPLELEQEQHALPGVDSHSGSCLLDNDKIGEIYGSPSGNVVPVKEEQETCANLVPHAFINEKLNELGVPPSNSVPVEPAVEAHGLYEYDYQDIPCSSINEEIDKLGVLPLSKPVLTQDSEVRVLGELDSQIVSSSLINETVDYQDGPPLRTALEVEQESEVRVLGELDSQIVSSSLINETVDYQDDPPLRTALEVEQESEVRVLGELDSQIVSSSLINETVDYQDDPPLRTALEVEQESEDRISSEHMSQIATSSVNEKIDELDAPPSSNAVLVEKETEVCVPVELDSEIAPCSSTNEKIYELDGPPSSGSALVELESEDNVSGGLDSQITPCSSVNDKIDEPDAAISISVLPVELEQEARSSPELDSEIAPCSLNDDKVGELDGPPACIVRVESENRSYCSPEFDSQLAPCSSNSGVLAETSTTTSISVMPSTEEKHLYSPVSPPTEPFTNVSYEDPKKPPPLPPLQWRLGRPRLGLVSTKGHMPDLVRRTNPVLPASSPDIDNRLGSLNGMAQLLAPVSSQEIKERYQNSIVDNNDQRVELGRLSTLPAVTDVVRTEHDRPFSEPCENIKHQGAMSSSATEAEEHLYDTRVVDGMALHQSNPFLPFPTYEYGVLQQGPQRCILSSDTSESSEHPSHTYQAASEDDKTVDDNNATGGVHLCTMGSSTPGHVSQNGCYQQPQRGESFSETSDNKEHSSNASYEEKNLKDQSITSGAPSYTTNDTTPGSVLEEGNSHEGQNLQEKNAGNSKEDQSEGPSRTAESIVPQDYQHGDHNLEREHIHQPSPVVAWPGDESKYVSDLDEGSNVHAEQPPVMGWTVGPQMLHPNYGISVEESRFVPEVTDHRLIRKPISIKNIPRNPLVDAVAAHDRSTMRKVSELVRPTDKPKPNERNLLLEQIRNKTFNLKPAGSAKPPAMRAPARASTRNLKVAAIIEKANAIRQAVGSDDEDGDNWSDT